MIKPSVDYDLGFKILGYPMKAKYLAFLSLIIISGNLTGAGLDSNLLSQKAPEHIEVNNRILARVNGKGISVIDVMKKMDIIFYGQYPEYAEIAPARYQFYMMHWKDVEKQLIDKELILVDVEESKLPVSNGDVRQEMETMFGPNMIDNLEKAGLSFDEAFKIVKGDIAIRRMMMAKVQGKAIRTVTPQAIHEAYEEYAKNNPRSHQWIYNVISIRDPDDKEGELSAKAVYKILADQKIPLKDFFEKFKETGVGKNSAINISDEFHHNDLEVSEAYKEVLFKLEPETFSQPVAQQSRRDRSKVWRIFYLKQVIPGGMVPFDEVEDQIKDNLIDIAVDKETDLYFIKLRKQFSVEEMEPATEGPEAFQPFMLK